MVLPLLVAHKLFFGLEDSFGVWGGGTLAACSHLPLESGFSVMIRAAADIPASFCLRKMHVYDYIPHLTPNPLQLLWSQVLKLGTGPDRRIVVLEFGEPESGLLV